MDEVFFFSQVPMLITTIIRYRRVGRPTGGMCRSRVGVYLPPSDDNPIKLIIPRFGGRLRRVMILQNCLRLKKPTAEYKNHHMHSGNLYLYVHNIISSNQRKGKENIDQGLSMTNKGGIKSIMISHKPVLLHVM